MAVVHGETRGEGRPTATLACAERVSCPTDKQTGTYTLRVHHEKMAEVRNTFRLRSKLVTKSCVGPNQRRGHGVSAHCVVMSVDANENTNCRRDVQTSKTDFFF